MHDEFEHRYGARERAYRESTHSAQGFWGLTLSGNVGVAEIARFYGLKVPPVEAGTTFAEFLQRRADGALRPGYRASVGGADFVVLEAENGVPKKIGLALRPMRGHQPWLRRIKKRRAA